MKKYLGGVVLVLALVLGGCDGERAKRRFYEQGSRLYEEGKFKEAALAFRKAIQRDSEFGEAYLALAKAELRADRSARAIPMLQRAAVLLPQQEEPKVLLADTLLASYAADPRKPTELLEAASSISRTLLSRNADSGDGMRIGGLVALARGDASTAAELLRQSNVIRPLSPGATVPYLAALFRSGRAQDGEAAALAALERYPDLSRAYDLLCMQYLNARRLGDAEALLAKKAASMNNADAMQQLAGFYFGTGKTEQMEAVIEQLRKDGQRFPQGRLQAGEFYARIGKPEEAFKEFQAGAAANGKDAAEYRKRMAALLLAGGDQEGAIRLFEDVLRQEPESIDVLAARATVWSETGQLEGQQAAIQEFRRLTERDPDNPMLYMQLGRIHMRRGDVPSARTQFEEALRKQRILVPARLALAEAAIVEGDFRHALLQTEEALGVDPQNLAARLLKVTALIGDRRLMQARSETAAILKMVPGSTEAELQLASVDMAEHKYADAEERYRRLRAGNRGGSAVLKGLVQSYSAQGKLRDAAALLEEEFRRMPDSLEVRALLAENAMYSRRAADAVAHYRAILARDAASAEWRFRLANALYEAGDAAAALREMEAACERAPNNTVYRMALASVLEQSGKPQGALNQYLRVVKAEPRHAFALNNAAYILAEMPGRLDEALDYAKRAVDVIPSNPNFSDTLGWVYVKKQMPDAALRVFAPVVRRDPENATLRYHHAVALLQRGDRARAKAELRSAMAQKVSPADAARIRQLFEELNGSPDRVP